MGGAEYLSVVTQIKFECSFATWNRWSKSYEVKIQNNLSFGMDAKLYACLAATHLKIGYQLSLIHLCSTKQKLLATNSPYTVFFHGMTPLVMRTEHYLT